MTNGSLDRTGERLLELLQADARRSVASLARELCLSRTAVQERIARLERDGWIEGYTLVAGHRRESGYHALLLLTIASRPCAPVLQAIRTLRPVQCVWSLTGPIDAIVEVRVDDAQALSELTDRIAAIDGVGSVQSQTVLATLNGFSPSRP